MAALTGAAPTALVTGDTPAALRVRVVAKRFCGRPVLRDVSFEIAAGERVALLGPSGVGKSTLLNIVAGLDTDFDGAVTRPAGRIAMAFQAPRLLPWRTLAQNIALTPGAGDLTRARALLAEVGLGDATEIYPERASLGMQRRAALARALAVRPALLLMDEPLNSLDAENAAAMRALIRAALARTGAAALMATHDPQDAATLADRALTLAAGDGPDAGATLAAG